MKIRAAYVPCVGCSVAWRGAGKILCMIREEYARGAVIAHGGVHGACSRLFTAVGKLLCLRLLVPESVQGGWGHSGCLRSVGGDLVQTREWGANGPSPVSMIRCSCSTTLCVRRSGHSLLCLDKSSVAELK